MFHDCSTVIEVVDILKEELKSKENCTSYGEPQAFYSLDNGRSLEVVIEQEGLSPSEYYYSVSLHCTGQEFDNGDYNSTCGVIDRYASSSLEDDDLYDMVAAALRCNESYPIAEHSKVPLEEQIFAAENSNSPEINQNINHIIQER